ncbi:MAG TPA: hypothetical protein VFQ01_01560 [Nocardioides sp.]|jgi:uncharacterized integral membrane protein|nr:hypothetical protein [Nocardioides sp.]
MVVLGLLLLAAGALAVLAAVFGTSGSASFLGADLGGTSVFFLGVAATLAVLCGLVLTRAGTGRALRHRREHRRLRALEREHGTPPSTVRESDGRKDTREEGGRTSEDPPVD